MLATTGSFAMVAIAAVAGLARSTREILVRVAVSVPMPAMKIPMTVLNRREFLAAKMETPVPITNAMGRGTVLRSITQPIATIAMLVP